MYGVVEIRGGDKTAELYGGEGFDGICWQWTRGPAFFFGHAFEGFEPLAQFLVFFFQAFHAHGVPRFGLSECTRAACEHSGTDAEGKDS